VSRVWSSQAARDITGFWPSNAAPAECYAFTRYEHRASLRRTEASDIPGLMSVPATLILASGCSPRRLRSALAARRLLSRTVAAGPTYSTQVSEMYT
jgi:hypothetical protein